MKILIIILALVLVGCDSCESTKTRALSNDFPALRRSLELAIFNSDKVARVRPTFGTVNPGKYNLALSSEMRSALPRFFRWVNILSEKDKIEGFLISAQSFDGIVVSRGPIRDLLVKYNIENDVIFNIDANAAVICRER